MMVASESPAAGESPAKDHAPFDMSNVQDISFSSKSSSKARRRRSLIMDPKSLARNLLSEFNLSDSVPNESKKSDPEDFTPIPAVASNESSEPASESMPDISAEGSLQKIPETSSEPLICATTLPSAPEDFKPTPPTSPPPKNTGPTPEDSKPAPILLKEREVPERIRMLLHAHPCLEIKVKRSQWDAQFSEQRQEKAFQLAFLTAHKYHFDRHQLSSLSSALCGLFRNDDFSAESYAEKKLKARHIPEYTFARAAFDAGIPLHLYLLLGKIEILLPLRDASQDSQKTPNLASQTPCLKITRAEDNCYQVKLFKNTEECLTEDPRYQKHYRAAHRDGLSFFYQALRTFQLTTQLTAMGDYS